MGIVQDTIVVVPCYNEERRLQTAAFRQALAGEARLRFLFVDDGSKDGTAELLKGLAAELPGRCLFLGLPQNSGKAEAVRRGILHAAAHHPELVGYWDADLATPLGQIAAFARTLENPDLLLVLGSRVHLLGREIRRTAARHYIGRLLATVAAFSLDIGVYDTQCGAKMLRLNRDTLSIFERPFHLDWFFDVELLARMLGLQVSGRCNVERQCVELVLDTWVDAPGSKIGLRQFPKVLSELARLPSVVRDARNASA